MKRVCYIIKMLRTVTSVRNLFCKRSFNSKVDLYKKPVREIEIPVSWGKITGKLWGHDNQQPILALHGWQDNAGSFNNLAPLLRNCSILAIDWPGHGHSSWLPSGIMYSEIIYLRVIKCVKNHFGWERIKLMAHSLGGIVSFTYSSLFNNEIEFVISIDAKHSSLDIDSITRQFRKNLKKFLEIEYLPISSMPSYSEDEAINRWRKSSNYSIDEQSCKELIIRGTRKKADGTVYFSRDPVLKFLTLSSFAYGQNVFKDMAKEIKNPYLMIKATDAKYVEKKKNVLEVADIIKENNMDFSFHKVPGTHHLHMTNPHAVVEIINPFLEKYNN